MPSLTEIEPVLQIARKAAIDYYGLTGKPLGITGEIGEFLAAKHLGLELVDARTPGFDAFGQNNRRIQIKSRSIPEGKRLTQRVGSISLDKEWDTVVLVLMNHLFEPFVMYEADRASIEEALSKPGSKSRNERGSLGVSQFISIGVEVWVKDDKPKRN